MAKSMEKFHKVISKIRDELRSEGISGMDGTRLNVLYCFSRKLTRKVLSTFSSLKLDDKLSWESNIELIYKNPELALKNFGVYKDCLISSLDKLFGTDNFKFEIKNSERHCRILELLNSINFEEITLNTDILGYIYEDHLKSGSSDPRDLGQFFTNRQVCDYMVKLCNPTLIEE